VHAVDGVLGKASAIVDLASEIERVQLIAVLETALAMLKAPMIEKNLLKKAASMLKRAAAKAVEKQVENAFAFAAGFAAGKITELLPYL